MLMHASEFRKYYIFVDINDIREFSPENLKMHGNIGNSMKYNSPNILSLDIDASWKSV